MCLVKVRCPYLGYNFRKSPSNPRYLNLFHTNYRSVNKGVDKHFYQLVRNKLYSIFLLHSKFCCIWLGTKTVLQFFFFFWVKMLLYLVFRLRIFIRPKILLYLVFGKEIILNHIFYLYKDSYKNLYFNYFFFELKLYYISSFG